MKAKITKNNKVQMTVSKRDAGILMTIFSRIGGNPITTDRNKTDELYELLESIGIRQTYQLPAKPFEGDVFDQANGKFTSGSLYFND